MALGLAFDAAAAPQPPQRPAAPGQAAPRSDRLPVANVPLPPSRPMDLGEDSETEEESPAEAAAPPATAPAPPSSQGASPPPPPAEAAKLAPGELPALCAALVEQKMILAERAPPVEAQAGCSLPVPVRLTGVRLADGNVAAFEPPAILRCEAAVAVAMWMREDMAPAVAAMGTRLETVKVADSYQCRPRNRVRGAKMSEHGMGNAFDTYGFVLADKRVLSVKGGGMPADFQTAMKDSACARFTTVLGPGSDGYHEDHIHVDLAVRRLDIRLCRWRIKAPAQMIARADPSGAAEETQAARQPVASGEAAEQAEEKKQEASASPVPLPPRRPASLPARSTPPG